MDQTVELYCGAERPFSQIAEALGYGTFTVDANPEYKPSLVSKVSEELAQHIPSSPLIVWAAPPFSEVFRSSDSWESDGSLYPRTEEAETAIKAMRNTIGLITALKPTWWFIEHPKSLVRKMPLFAGFNRGYPSRNRRLINHSQFGEGKVGLSDVWTNAYWWLPDTADNDAVNNLNGSPAERVPPFVYAQMLEQLDNYRRFKSYGTIIPDQEYREPH